MEKARKEAEEAKKARMRRKTGVDGGFGGPEVDVVVSAPPPPVPPPPPPLHHQAQDDERAAVSAAFPPPLARPPSFSSAPHDVARGPISTPMVREKVKELAEQEISKVGRTSIGLGLGLGLGSQLYGSIFASCSK